MRTWRLPCWASLGKWTRAQRNLLRCRRRESSYTGRWYRPSIAPAGSGFRYILRSSPNRPSSFRLRFLGSLALGDVAISPSPAWQWRFESSRTANIRHFLDLHICVSHTASPLPQISVCIYLNLAGIMHCAITVTRCSRLAHPVQYIGACPAREHGEPTTLDSRRNNE